MNENIPECESSIKDGFPIAGQRYVWTGFDGVLDNCLNNKTCWVAFMRSARWKCHVLDATRDASEIAITHICHYLTVNRELFRSNHRLHRWTWHAFIVAHNYFTKMISFYNLTVNIDQILIKLDVIYISQLSLRSFGTNIITPVCNTPEQINNVVTSVAVSVVRHFKISGRANRCRVCDS